MGLRSRCNTALGRKCNYIIENSPLLPGTKSLRAASDERLEWNRLVATAKGRPQKLIN